MEMALILSFGVVGGAVMVAAITDLVKFKVYNWLTLPLALGGVFYHTGGPTIRMYFHFYLTPRGWRIYDVNSNGVSAVTDLRRQFFARRFRR